MALALLCGAALPEAFGERGLAFALCYVVMQVGRSAFVVSRLPFTHPLAANYRRILGWGLIASVFWIAGGLSSPDMRLPLWAMGVLCEYVSPMFGFWLPGLGRSHTSDWTISGSHLVERCQLFVIVALGETVMASGLSMAETSTWSLMELTAFVISFLCTIAMWWLYFETSSEEAEHAISRSSDPGRMGALFHYLHAILIGGIIITAVGMDILLENPLEPAEGASKLVLALGPAFYLLGSSLYHWVSTQKIPALQAGGALLFSLAAVFVPALPRWELAGAESAVLLAISAFAGGSLKEKFL